MKLVARMCTFSIVFCFLLLGSLSHSEPYAIVIHGGAGTINKNNMTPERYNAYRNALRTAVDAGYEILARGGSSQDAIITAINFMENSPLFNAGKGAVYNFEGVHELDASIMDGNTMTSGAVAGVKHIKNPISLARLVKDKSAHVLLTGQGAEEFALEQGMSLIGNSYFNTEFRHDSFMKAKAKLRQSNIEKKNSKVSTIELENDMSIDYKYGTVGAVAIDQRGNIAAGTSTGGRTAKRWGRIGDSPIIGAGTWADNASCGVSATGHGEFFINFNVAADICARVKYKGLALQRAADEVIHETLKPAGGDGGVIAISKLGEVAWSFNTEGMYRAYRSSNGQSDVKVYKK